jgi:hypothetical protein
MGIPLQRVERNRVRLQFEKLAAVALGDRIAGVAGTGIDDQLAVIVRLKILKGRDGHLDGVARRIDGGGGRGVSP